MPSISDLELVNRPSDSSPLEWAYSSESDSGYDPNCDTGSELSSHYRLSLTPEGDNGSHSGSGPSSRSSSPVEPEVYTDPYFRGFRFPSEGLIATPPLILSTSQRSRLRDLLLVFTAQCPDEGLRQYVVQEWELRVLCASAASLPDRGDVLVDFDLRDDIFLFCARLPSTRIFRIVFETVYDIKLCTAEWVAEGEQLRVLVEMWAALRWELGETTEVVRSSPVEESWGRLKRWMEAKEREWKEGCETGREMTARPQWSEPEWRMGGRWVQEFLERAGEAIEAAEGMHVSVR